MAFHIELDVARVACADSIRAFEEAAESLSEYDLLAPSRCHGWSRLDVVVHVIGGLQELAAGLLSRTGDDPTVDAASYWSTYADGEHQDPVDLVMSQWRRTAAYARPDSARRQLRDLSTLLVAGVQSAANGRHPWQGEVFSTGDFLAMWAVEHTIHQLDLDTVCRLPDTAVALTCETIRTLVGTELPSTSTREQVVLVGSGRQPVPADAADLADRLPALR